MSLMTEATATFSSLAKYFVCGVLSLSPLDYSSGSPFECFIIADDAAQGDWDKIVTVSPETAKEMLADSPQKITIKSVGHVDILFWQLCHLTDAILTEELVFLFHPDSEKEDCMLVFAQRTPYSPELGDTEWGLRSYGISETQGLLNDAEFVTPDSLAKSNNTLDWILKRVSLGGRKEYSSALVRRVVFKKAWEHVTQRKLGDAEVAKLKLDLVSK